MWVFNPITQRLVFTQSIEQIVQAGEIDLGSGDLSIDTGLRENDSSTLDQGERI
jgi:hypothetical protein